MKAGSVIINNASINAYIGRSDLLDYTSSKGAIVSFTRGLSNQYISKGIRVNAVAPGPGMNCITPDWVTKWDWPHHSLDPIDTCNNEWQGAKRVYKSYGSTGTAVRNRKLRRVPRFDGQFLCERSNLALQWWCCGKWLKGIADKCKSWTINYVHKHYKFLAMDFRLLDTRYSDVFCGLCRQLVDDSDAGHSL